MSTGSVFIPLCLPTALQAPLIPAGAPTQQYPQATTNGTASYNPFS